MILEPSYRWSFLETPDAYTFYGADFIPGELYIAVEWNMSKCISKPNKYFPITSTEEFFTNWERDNRCVMLDLSKTEIQFSKLLFNI